jgi:hypothetical protein
MQLLKPISLLLAPVLVMGVVGCVGLTVKAEPTQESVPTTPPLEPSAPSATPTGAPTAVQQTLDGCVGPEIHPIGQRIADNFEVSYEQVITWHCEGNEFEDILLALETNEMNGVRVETLLEMRANDRSWEQIWEELGITD